MPMRSTISAHKIECTCACALMLYGLLAIFRTSVHLRVQSKLRLASHERLPVQMHLNPTAETDRQPLVSGQIKTNWSKVARAAQVD